MKELIGKQVYFSANRRKQTNAKYMIAEQDGELIELDNIILKDVTMTGTFNKQTADQFKAYGCSVIMIGTVVDTMPDNNQQEIKLTFDRTGQYFKEMVCDIGVDQAAYVRATETGTTAILN